MRGHKNWTRKKTGNRFKNPLHHIFPLEVWAFFNIYLYATKVVFYAIIASNVIFLSYYMGWLFTFFPFFQNLTLLITQILWYNWRLELYSMLIFDSISVITTLIYDDFFSWINIIAKLNHGPVIYISIMGVKINVNKYNVSIFL